MQSKFFIICEATVAAVGLVLLIARLTAGAFPIDNLVGVVTDAMLVVGCGGAALLAVRRRRRSRHLPSTLHPGVG